MSMRRRVPYALHRTTRMSIGRSRGAVSEGCHSSAWAESRASASSMRLERSSGARRGCSRVASTKIGVQQRRDVAHSPAASWGHETNSAPWRAICRGALPFLLMLGLPRLDERRSILMRLLTLATVLLGFALSADLASARAEGTEVDLALVLAVDVSLSMTADEQQVQRGGYIDAFRSTAVKEAIRQGLIGRIAVTYVEWAGPERQDVVVPWTVIGTAQEAEGFAAQLARTPPLRALRTSISGALDFSVEILRTAGFEATRRVIDISGDGPNNSGRAVTRARDDAVAAGIVVNGLPLMIREPTGPYDIPDLDLYYRDCVIGGPGAFMVPVREAAEFAKAIRTKIVREVAEPARPAARVLPAQMGTPIRCALTGQRVPYDIDP
ncbi:DUF1194 domain-containing protein [Methylobacterium symbioticum]|nr:DUF1194 domain-containing protein [Methylobacterium symbioticum]